MRDAESRFPHSTCSAVAGRCAQDAFSAPVPGTGAPSRGRVRALAAALAAVAALLAVFAPSALAVDNGHAFSKVITGEGTNKIGTYLPDIAVRQSNGHIYVLDNSNYRVEEFDENGAFILMFGKKVNETTGGNICPVNPGDVCKAGEYAGAPEGVGGVGKIAIDQSNGDIYLAGYYNGYFVSKYDEGGHPVSSWMTNGVTNGSTSPGGEFSEVRGLDVDGSSHLLVLTGYGENTRLVKYNANGSSPSEVSVGSYYPYSGFAWSSQGFDYIGWNQNYSHGGLRRFSAADGSGMVNVSEDFQPTSHYPRNVAVDQSTGDVFVLTSASSTNEVGTFEYQVNGSGQPLKASGEECSKTLSPTEYGCPPTHEFGFGTFSYPKGVGGRGDQSGIDVNESTHTVYTTAIVPTAAGQYVDKGQINVFIKAKSPEAVTGEPTANKTVSGTAKPDGAEITECWFEYGSTQDYGTNAPCSPAPNYATEEAVSANLSIANESTYHYRLVVKDSNGAVAVGADRTITPHNVLGVETLSPENPTRTSVKMRGSYHGDGTETKYWFRWGPSAGSYTSGESAPAVTGSPAPTYPPATEVTYEPTNLKPQTLYHYQVVFEKVGTGITYGNDMTFETLPAVQKLTTLPVSNLQRRAATMNGSFEGDGTATEYWFEWGKAPVYGHSTEAIKITPAKGTTATVHVELTGCGSSGTEPGACLELETNYQYRIVAKNVLGQTTDGRQEFKTLPAVAGVKTLEATNISDESITLNGEFNGNEEDTTYYFEYGPTAEYGMKTPVTDAGSPSGVTHVSALIDEYEGFTTYHYRLVAHNAVGDTFGNDETFETEEAELPEVGGARATEIGPSSATLSAEINPNRWGTVYAFDYGTTSEYGNSTLIKEVIDGNGNSSVPVSAELTELAPGTTYHFRVVAINIVGTTHGPDQTFTTPNVPSIESVEATYVTETTAHLAGTVVPNASSTTFHFEYGSGSGFPHRTPESAPIGSDTNAHGVQADLSGLTPGTGYHYRLVATNAVGSTVSAEGTFTTQATPVPPEEEEKKELTCRKGFVKRHGKCVRRHHKHHHKHRKHHRHRGGANG